ncbi:MAG: MBL fold metallo-hydrolase [Treponema sp.]|jgi:phosphoribosyl 1,2-cyclic phosphate phosphodiesterase|nr:MBL fold metallo-hydrolase [Treponema sp.]
MEILFLGTAAAEGIPALFCRCTTCINAAQMGGREHRSRCGFLINQRLMLDLTPDCMHHKFRYNLDLAAVEALCLTHSHTDHLNAADLCFRTTGCYAHIPDEKPLRVYGNKKCGAVIRQGLDFDLGSPDNPSLEIYEIGVKSIIECGALTITALRARHDPREDCLLFLVREGDATFLQMNDTALPGEELEQDLAEALEGRTLKAVSMDCTHGKMKGSSGHMGIAENFTVKKRLTAAGLANQDTRFIANHFSHNGGVSYEESAELLSPQDIVPAYDGMLLRI